MKHIFYQPQEGWAGDFIPFYWDGEFHLFYLRDIRSPRGHLDGVPWYRVSTRDFVDFTDHGLVLAPGGYDDQDLCCYTGCVFYGEGKFHMYYEGMNPRMRSHGRPEQGFIHAVSDDLQHWEKLPGCFFSPEGYEDHDWRDPFVFYEESDGLYHMALAARRSEGPKTRRGVTAHLISSDLYNWEVIEPFWEPNSYYTHECPDMFKIGPWYYMIFSEFTDTCRTRYVMSRSINGPWISPADDVFDTRAYYAAKSWSDGKKRYLFGWNPTRADNNDAKDFQWGGNLVVHELYQKEDGALATREPPSIAAAWGNGRPLAFSGSDHKTIDCIDGMKTEFADEKLPLTFRFEADVAFTAGTRAFGLMLRADKTEDTSYGFIFTPSQNRLHFDALPEPHWNNMRTRGLDRIMPMKAGHKMRLSIVADDTMATMYVDDQVAFTTRMYNYHGDGLALYVQHGSVTFENIRVWTDNPRDS